MTQETLDSLQGDAGLQCKIKTKKALADTWNTHTLTRKLNKTSVQVPTCTRLLMTWGSMLRGNLRMLKSDRDTKAFSASRTWFSSTVTYTANVVKATWEYTEKQDIQAQRSIRRDVQQSLLWLSSSKSSIYSAHQRGDSQWYVQVFGWGRIYLYDLLSKSCYRKYLVY